MFSWQDKAGRGALNGGWHKGWLAAGQAAAWRARFWAPNLMTPIGLLCRLRAASELGSEMEGEKGRAGRVRVSRRVEGRRRQQVGAQDAAPVNQGLRAAFRAAIEAQ